MTIGLSSSPSDLATAAGAGTASFLPSTTSDSAMASPLPASESANTSGLPAWVWSVGSAAAMGAGFGATADTSGTAKARVGESVTAAATSPGAGSFAAARPESRKIRVVSISVRGGASLAASLREHLELAFLFRELATLTLDVPLVNESLDDLRWKGAHRAPFEALAEKLAAPDLIGRVPRWAD